MSRPFRPHGRTTFEGCMDGDNLENSPCLRTRVPSIKRQGIHDMRSRASFKNLLQALFLVPGSHTRSVFVDGIPLAKSIASWNKRLSPSRRSGVAFSPHPTDCKLGTRPPSTPRSHILQATWMLDVRHRASIEFLDRPHVFTEEVSLSSA